jgi:hypothetical protein
MCNSVQICKMTSLTLKSQYLIPLYVALLIEELVKFIASTKMQTTKLTIQNHQTTKN